MRQHRVRQLPALCLLVCLLTLLTACTGSDGPNDNPPPAPRFTLSGTITSAAGSFVDGDINDPNAAYIANDTPSLAQTIPNPVMLGGYLNEPGTGAAGPSFSPGDVSDFYRISLAANQTITLDIADFNTGDLDLYLYRDDGSIDVQAPDDGSIGIGRTETLTVTQAGDYVIEVAAFTGYTNYALIIGQGMASAAGDGLRFSDEFVPGDVIVRFKPAPQPLAASQTPVSRAASLGLRAKAGSPGRAMLLALGEGQDRQLALQTLGVVATRKGNPGRQFRSADPRRQSKLETLQMIKALRKRKDVLYAEPNYIRRSKLVPSDTYYDLQWHYPLINLPAAWDVTTGSSNVIVAVIDTGVLLGHPDLAGQFSADGGYDFIRDDAISQDDEPGIDTNPDDPGDSTIGGSSFHGTHVAGTIAAVTRFDGGGRGVAGVAPGVKIMPLRALGTGGGTSYDILQAVRYAAGLPNDSGGVPARTADIINLSLGGGDYSRAEQDVFTQARNAGVVIVAAAGNEATATPSYPAAYAGVVSVSAVDINKQLAPYSNFGASIDVTAPGGDSSRDVNGDGRPDGILSAVGDDSGVDAFGNKTINFVYGYYQGTSMAAPHVAGVVALMKSVYAGLTPTDVDNLLGSGSIIDDIGAAGRDDQFGHGLINARLAVDEATRLATGGSLPDFPLLSVTPASLNFGSRTTALSLSVVNGGDGALNVTAVSDDADWLTVSEDTVDASSKLGSYRVLADRSNLTAGIYTASITVTSDANSISVPVILQVVSQSADADAGYHYILLLDADNGNLFASTEGGAQNGEYRFRFADVPFPAGRRYVIYAGTDLDNDGLICDEGEACGVYLSRSQPKPIAADDTHSGLDFGTGFSIGLQNQSLGARGIAVPRGAGKRLP